MTNRPSTISRLPEEVREKIAQLREEGRTIDEIMMALDALRVDVSRSALGRHVKKLDSVTKDMMRARNIAAAIGRSFGDTETSKVARTNVEILHSLVMQLMIGGDGEGEDGQPVKLDPKDAMFLATAMEKMAKASKTDFDQQLKAAEEAARRAEREKAADTVEKEVRKAGLSAETVDAIKAKILGVSK